MSNHNNSLFPRGSEWRKWDLHVHTPKSIYQEYGGDTEEVWNLFIKKIAELPTEIQVIGITDYLFVDGYEYLLTRRDEIPNIKLIIPNIEFRLNTFSGTVFGVRTSWTDLWFKLGDTFGILLINKGVRNESKSVIGIGCSGY